MSPLQATGLSNRPGYECSMRHLPTHVSFRGDLDHLPGGRLDLGAVASVPALDIDVVASKCGIQRVRQLEICWQLLTRPKPLDEFGCGAIAEVPDRDVTVVVDLTVHAVLFTDKELLPDHGKVRGRLIDPRLVGTLSGANDHLALALDHINEPHTWADHFESCGSE